MDGNKIIDGYHFLGKKFWFSLYSQSRRSVSCKFKDYLKINYNDWMTIRILLLSSGSILFEYRYRLAEHSELQ